MATVTDTADAGKDPNVVSPYVEGPVYARLWTQVTYSSPAGNSYPSLQNQFRQGVELNTDEQYYTGIVKIHSGYPEHQLPQQEFGFKKIRVTPYVRFEEIDLFNPVTFITFNQYFSDETELRVYENSFPLTVTDIDRYEYFNVDGAIEPLAIRPKAANFSMEAPFFSHDVHASMAEGNQNYKFSNDKIVTQICSKEERSETNYFDSVDTAGGAGILIGYVSPEVATIYPVNDGINKYGILITDNMTDEMVRRIKEMQPCDDSYVTPDCKSATLGLCYDFNNSGTDSIAFGGLSNSNIITWEMNKA